MTRLWSFAASLPIWVFLVVGPCQAEDLKVRSGEHPGFSRLVFPLPPSTKWELGRSNAGYGLHIDVPDIAFDTTHVFDLIPRTRIRALRTGQAAGLLYIDLSCTCHAVATQQPGGQLIVDVADGLPETSSGFERPLAEMAPPASPDVPVLARALLHPVQGTPKTEAAAAATILFKPIVSADDTQPIRWGLPPVVSTPHQLSSAPDRPVAEPPSSLTVTGTAEEAPAKPHSRSASQGQVTEAELLRQLSRAAAQGLVRVDLLKLPARPRTGALADTGVDPEHLARNDDSANPAPPAIHVETSMDQTAPVDGDEQALTPEGSTCISDEDVALSSWGSDDPAADQIAAARANLTGEFDRPDTGKIDVLARLYLFFGMGAEARQTLQAFNVKIDKANLLTDLAHILDGEPLSPDSALHQMRECASGIALWAFLAAPSAQDVRLTPIAPVVRAFLSLPPNLRQTLGSRLSDRLIELGAVEAAGTIAKAVARLTGGESREARMIDVRLDLQLGQTESAEATLATIPANNDELSASAIELAAQTRLARGEMIGSDLVETVASLAFERQAVADGGRLAGLEVMARAASGDFKGALAAFDRWSKDQPNLDRAGTAHDLFDLLVKRATDADFIALYFDGKAAFQVARKDLQLRLGVAQRLMDLGFAEEVGQVLGDGAGETKEGKILRARAALSLYNPRAAIELVDGLAGEEAAQIRSSARITLGDDPAAEGPETAATADAQQDFARDDNAGVDSEATLAGTKAVLKDSAALRQSIATQLADGGNAQPSP